MHTPTFMLPWTATAPIAMAPTATALWTAWALRTTRALWAFRTFRFYHIYKVYVRFAGVARERCLTREATDIFPTIDTAIGCIFLRRFLLFNHIVDERYFINC